MNIVIFLQDDPFFLPDVLGDFLKKLHSLLQNHKFIDLAHAETLVDWHTAPFIRI